MPFQNATRIIGGIAETATIKGMHRIYSVNLKTDGSNAASLTIYWTHPVTNVRETIDFNCATTGGSPYQPSLPIATYGNVVVDPTGTGAIAWLAVDDYTSIAGGATATSNVISRFTGLLYATSSVVSRVTVEHCWTDLPCTLTKA